eukprot:16448749-Heterocapsa_arctica.AAC.1
MSDRLLLSAEGQRGQEQEPTEVRGVLLRCGKKSTACAAQGEEVPELTKSSYHVYYNNCNDIKNEIASQAVRSGATTLPSYF